MSDDSADPRNPDRWDAFDPSERYSERVDRCIKKLRENDSNLAASVTVTVGNDGYVRDSLLAGLAAVGFAAMTLGFGRAAKRDARSRMND